MINLIVGLFIGIQMLFGLVSPVLLVYFTALTGAIPLTIGREDALSGDFGRMDLPAIRLLGLWIAIVMVLMPQIRVVQKQVVMYKFHVIFLVFCIVALGWSSSLVYGLRMLAKLTAPFLFFLLVYSAITSMRQLKILERCIFASAMISILLAVATKLSGQLPNEMLTLPGTSAAVFSSHLVAVSMLALAGLLYEQRTLHSFVLVCCVAAVIAAFTRITIGGLFIGSASILLLALRGLPRLALPMGGVIGLPALFLLSERFRNRMFYGGDNISVGSVMNDPSYALEHVHGSGRFAAWAQFLKLFFEPSPLIGSGIGTTQHYFYTHSITGLGVIHSEYIRLLCEVGIFGLGLFAVAALAYLFRLLRAYQQHKRANVGRYALAAMGAFLAYLVFLATDNGFDYVSQFSVYVFGYIAMSEKAKELEEHLTLPETSTAYANSSDDRNDRQTSMRYPILQE